MAVIVGQIQPLKLIRESLDKKNISRFNSIADINDFLRSFESEKNAIPEKENRILNEEIQSLEASIETAERKSQKNFIYKLFYGIRIRIYTSKKASIEKRFDKIWTKRCIESIGKIDSLKKTVDELYPLISGAVGENAVVNELKKLPDSFYIINDFRVEFNPPIYNKNEHDRIRSIQIDHLLICPSGVFVIETKNWSSDSIQRLDLRSPVDQIKRSSFALFVSLNNEANLEFMNHHWGNRKVPVRNIIVMTNSMPNEEFNYTKILPIDSLKGYVEYFEPIFSETEAESLFHYLNNWNQINRK